MTEASGEGRHLIAGARRAHIQASQLRSGQAVFVVPSSPGVPRAPKLGAIPADGALMTVTDYLLGCASRGSIVCYEPDGEVPAEASEDQGGAG